MRKSVSVVIVTYNSEKHIFDCLDSLFTYNDIEDELEVIIVDNQSFRFVDTRNQLEQKYGNKLIIIQNDRNGGYGQGNNVGIEASSAPIIMIMNPDVRLVQPVFKRALDAFKDQRVVQFGMQQLDKEGNRAYSFAVSSSIHPIIGLPLTGLCNKLNLFIPSIMFVVGACFFIRKSSLKKIGMFDERLFMYMEEDDIQYRLMKRIKNATIKYDKTLGYAHLHGMYSEKKDENFTYEKTALKNNLLINGERGLSERAIINREIIWNRLFVIKEEIVNLIPCSPETKQHITHLRSWLKQIRAIKTGESQL